MKDLEARNLVVPVVGDFGGPKAIRAVGSYLKQRTAMVTAFYLSNVEQYLRQDGKSTAFCRNVATLPLDASSVFIRPSGAGLTVYRPMPVHRRAAAGAAGLDDLASVYSPRSSRSSLDALSDGRGSQELRRARARIFVAIDHGYSRRLFSPLTLTFAFAVCLAAYAVGLARDTQSGRLPLRAHATASSGGSWSTSPSRAATSSRTTSSSNERPFQNVVPALRQFPRGGVYLGVAPEQNFTYIAALEPRMAFILDIRRGNLHRASDVQGDLRAVGRPRGVRLAICSRGSGAVVVEDLDRPGVVRGICRS